MHTLKRRHNNNRATISINNLNEIVREVRNFIKLSVSLIPRFLNNCLHVL